MHNVPKSKDERGTVDALDEFGVLMDRHVINERVFDARADRVPARAEVFEPAQDQRLAKNDLYRIVVELFFADCDDIGKDVGIWIPSRS